MDIHMGNCPARAQPRTAATALARRSERELKVIYKRAGRREVHLLRIRRRWAYCGLALQAPAVVDTFDGLERLKGALTRPKRGRRPSRT